jgi:hypothetical protein
MLKKIIDKEFERGEREKIGVRLVYMSLGPVQSRMRFTKERSLFLVQIRLKNNEIDT